MNTLSSINFSAKNDPLGFITCSEERYHNEIKSLAEKILNNEKYKIVLLAGPSGSGKTTTAHILKEYLFNIGLSAQVVSLDNFYLTTDKMPRLSNGQPDFETVYSLDIAEIYRCFSQIISVGKTDMPIFNFSKKSREEKLHTIDVSKGGIIIVEGLHALNPILYEKLPSDSLLKVYISVNDYVTHNSKKLLSSRKMRLARRLSRDYIYRNTTPMQTLKLWTSVVEGEEKYLYCFKDTADLVIKTFHMYEPCVFRDVVYTLLKDLPETAENYNYAIELREALLRFEAISVQLVPENSLLREFISGGRFENSK